LLANAEFNTSVVNEQQAKQLIDAGQALLDQASACASSPQACAQ
jgi:hypothetical protein